MLPEWMDVAVEALVVIFAIGSVIWLLCQLRPIRRLGGVWNGEGAPDDGAQADQVGDGSGHGGDARGEGGDGGR